jgi:hypothetical protein
MDFTTTFSGLVAHKIGNGDKGDEKLLLDASKNKMHETNQLNKLLVHESLDAYQNDWALLSQAQHYGIAPFRAGVSPDIPEPIFSTFNIYPRPWDGSIPQLN